MGQQEKINISGRATLQVYLGWNGFYNRYTAFWLFALEVAVAKVVPLVRTKRECKMWTSSD